MIQSKEDLRLYLEKDCNAIIKKPDCGWLRRILFTWYGSESYRLLNFMIALRHYEYYLNCHVGRFGIIRRLFWQIRYKRLSSKLGILIPPNVVGFGFNSYHLVGGLIINCKSAGCNLRANSGVIVGNGNSGELATIGDNVYLSVGSMVMGGG